jgi:phosphohistidine phosphatase
MKTLVLLRHAKAVPEHAGGDFQRPLSPRGCQQVQAVAAAFLAQGWKPQLTIASPAARTLQTAQGIETNIGDLNIITDRSLYLATAQQIYSALAALPESLDRVMLVGHNPGLSDLAAHFSATPENEELPTAGFVTCQLNITHWQQIANL